MVLREVDETVLVWVLMVVLIVVGSVDDSIVLMTFVETNLAKGYLIIQPSIIIFFLIYVFFVYN